MVRGSRTPPQPQPMMAPRVDEKGRKWGPGRSVPRPQFPFSPLELAPTLGPGIWDLDWILRNLGGTACCCTQIARGRNVRSFSIEGGKREDDEKSGGYMFPP